VSTIKKKTQRQLKEIYEHQNPLCDCGYPIPPMCRTLRESFWISEWIYVEHEYVCSECNKKHIRIG